MWGLRVSLECKQREATSVKDHPCRPTSWQEIEMYFGLRVLRKRKKKGRRHIKLGGFSGDRWKGRKAEMSKSVTTSW